MQELRILLILFMAHKAWPSFYLVKMKKTDISIIIPVFNEEESIDVLFSEIKNNIDKKFKWELFFINDGSIDASKDKIIKIVNDNQNIRDYFVKSNSKIINDIYSSYDISLNTKYKVKIFQSTLDRVKNYFR